MAYGSLLADVVQGSTAGTPPQFNDGNGTQVGTLCRAWVNFNGTTSPGTIRASFNVTSVTKNGTGDYTVNFTNALSDANYSVTGSAGTTTSNQYVFKVNTTSALSTTAVRIGTTTMSGGSPAVVDSDTISVSVFR